ncbi:hypothetical protein SARC_18112, partial [Sphaeroforma arctica JP610]
DSLAGKHPKQESTAAVYNLSPPARKYLAQEWKKLFKGTLQSRMSLVGSALAFATVLAFRAEKVKEHMDGGSNK